MHGGHRRREVARISGPLRRLLGAFCVLAALTASSQPSTAALASEAPGSRWYAPVEVDGKVFPVLLPADGRWLNWRDTYGAPRMRLVGEVWKQVGVHRGIDIFGEQGAPVVSVAAGVVERVGWTFYSGWRVGVRGTDGRYYFYAHLRSFQPGIAEGRPVEAGRPLGTVGNSGYGGEGTQDEFPPHLHFGLQGRGGWENPEPLLRNLYRGADARIRRARLDALGIARAVRSLRARAYAPGAPPPDALRRAVAALEAERAALERSMLAG